MSHSPDFHTGWRAALRALAKSVPAPAGDENPGQGALAGDDDDAEREAFHLDDTELATRLIRDRSLLLYSTPPHARLLFPDMVRP